MKRKRIVRLALSLAVLALALPALAGNIVLLRMGGNPIYPNSANNDITQSNSFFLAFGTNNCDGYGTWTEANQIAYTNVDDTFVVALTNAGHHVVTYWVNNSGVSDADLARLNASDVVFVDFTPNSGSFNLSAGGLSGAGCSGTNTGHKWNTLVTAPMILTKAVLAQPASSRMGWFTGISSNDWSTWPLGNRPHPNDYDTANNLSTTASGKLTFVDQSNPLFVGITTTNDGSGNRVMSNYYMLDISTNVLDPGLAGNYWLPSIPKPIPAANGGLVWPYAAGDLYNRGTSLAALRVVQNGTDNGWTNDLSPGGRILATMEFNPMIDPASDPLGGDNPPQGTAPVPDPTWVVTSYAIAEWPLGSKAFRNCGDPNSATADFCDTLGGYRMYLGVGTRDPNTGNLGGMPDGTGGRSVGFFAGGWNLTPDGEKIFLRAVDRAILQGNLPSLSVARNGSNVTVSWNPAVVTWKLQESTDLATWTDVTTGVVNNSYTPSPLGGQEFFRLAVK